MRELNNYILPTNKLIFSFSFGSLFLERKKKKNLNYKFEKKVKR